MVRYRRIGASDFAKKHRDHKRISCSFRSFHFNILATAVELQHSTVQYSTVQHGTGQDSHYTTLEMDSSSPIIMHLFTIGRDGKNESDPLNRLQYSTRMFSFNASLERNRGNAREHRKDFADDQLRNTTTT